MKRSVGPAIVVALALLTSSCSTLSGYGSCVWTSFKDGVGTTINAPVTGVEAAKAECSHDPGSKVLVQYASGVGTGLWTTALHLVSGLVSAALSPLCLDILTSGGAQAEQPAPPTP